jgi:hypothetical protein
LGHVISFEGIFMDPMKVKVILRWERPANVTKIRSFLRLVRYYWRFIEGFFTIMPFDLFDS